MQRGGRLAALSAPLEAVQEAEVARVIEEPAGPEGLRLLQQKQHRFLTGAAMLYRRELRAAGHCHARGVLLETPQTLGSRLGRHFAVMELPLFMWLLI